MEKTVLYTFRAQPREYLYTCLAERDYKRAVRLMNLIEELDAYINALAINGVGDNEEDKA